MKRREFVAAGLALAAGAPLRGWSAILNDVGDVAARSLDGGDLNLPGRTVEEFAAGLRGELMLQGDPAYDARRRVWNGMFDRKPALIACCTGAADVRRAVDFAREHRLLTAVRAGGHSFSGKSTCEGGLVIDLQSMQGVRVDPDSRRAYLEAGSLLGQLDHECAPFGLATTAGTVSHTGAAGLTLGGGFGWLGRRFGLACDNAASFDVVTADGQLVRASDVENSDLYWGLRGGGGNFGVVTEIEYRLHRVDPIVLGINVVWPLDQARDVMRHYRDLAADAPDAVNIGPGLHSEPDGPKIALAGCWSGDLRAGEAWLGKLRSFGKPARDETGPVPYVKLQSGYDQVFASGQYYYLKSGFLTRLEDDGIDLVIDAFRRMPDWYLMFFEHGGGAYGRVAPDATAFPNREAALALGAIGIWPDRNGMDEKVERMRANWRELEPLTRGFYTNYADADEPLSAYRENYGANLERLMALKAKYDPMNLFRLNANVPPRA
jgi:FAD/FMN-containing dehydrogenase